MIVNFIHITVSFLEAGVHQHFFSVCRKTYDLEEFSIEQQQSLNRAMQKLSNIRRHIIKLAEGVCTVSCY